MLLTKVPAPVPSLVWLPLTNGEAEVLQHTPLAVTADPPIEVTFPPLVAVVWVMAVTAAVVTAGRPEVEAASYTPQSGDVH
jgi:hypothetical protein